MNKGDEWQFLVIWEFIVRPGTEQAFESIYGPNGDWVKLFREACGYCRTTLTRDCEDPRRYFTLDFWKSQEDYEKFKSQHETEYKAIDTRCEALTERETEIGQLMLLRTGD